LKDADNNAPHVSHEELIDEENKELREEDEMRGKEEKRRKARLRTRGPYRKAHADW
jgi:hypothetical protein